MSMSKIIVITSEQCPHCNVLKEKLAGDDRFKILDVATDQEAKDLVLKLNIKDVPAFLFYDDQTKKTCRLEKDQPSQCIEDGS